MCQSVAVLETLHAAVGLVRSGVSANFVQWLGRSHVALFVLSAVPGVKGVAAVGWM